MNPIPMDPNDSPSFPLSGPPTPLLNSKELAEYLSLSEKQVWRLKEAGILPSIRLGGAVRFRLSDIDRALNENQGPGKSPVE
jgi:excisionase family DNA binding protein